MRGTRVKFCCSCTLICRNDEFKAPLQFYHIRLSKFNVNLMIQFHNVNVGWHEISTLCKVHSTEHRFEFVIESIIGSQSPMAKLQCWLSCMDSVK